MKDARKGGRPLLAVAALCLTLSLAAAVQAEQAGSEVSPGRAAPAVDGGAEGSQGLLPVQEAPQPGTEADPLVAKSYLDSLLPQILSQYVTRADLAALTAPPSYQVVSVPAGSIFIASGGTELILRGGRAAAVTTAEGGLADVTTGQDLQSGARIPANHLVIVPRDGRGFIAETDVIVLVRGPYQIH